MMPDRSPHVGMLLSQQDRHAAAAHVHAHRDHAGDSGTDRSTHHLARIAEFLEVKMGVYEDAACSSSTTSSRRLKSALGSGNGWPGASTDGRQRFSIG